MPIMKNRNHFSCGLLIKEFQSARWSGFVILAIHALEWAARAGQTRGGRLKARVFLDLFRNHGWFPTAPSPEPWNQRAESSQSGIVRSCHSSPLKVNSIHSPKPRWSGSWLSSSAGGYARDSVISWHCRLATAHGWARCLVQLRCCSCRACS